MFKLSNIKKQNKRLLKSLVFISTVGLFGCSSVAFNTDYNPERHDFINADSIPFNQYQDDSSNTLKDNLDTISTTNYKGLLYNQVSGVYQHPFYQNRYLTLVFGDELDRFVQRQLNTYGLMESYKKQVNDFHFPNHGNLAGIHFITGNYSFYDANPVLLNKSRNRDDPRLHHFYFLLMHEVAHSTHGQYALIQERYDQVAVENASDITASILLYQLIREEGFGFRYYLKLMNDEKRISQNDLKTHRTQHVFDVMPLLIKNNPERFFLMSKSDIDVFAYLLSKDFSTHDYSRNGSNQDISSDSYLKRYRNINYMYDISLNTRLFFNLF